MVKQSSQSKPRKAAKLLPLPTPGEILAEEFLKPFGLSQNALARALHVPPRRINEIVLGQRAKKREIAKELVAIAVRAAAE